MNLPNVKDLTRANFWYEGETRELTVYPNNDQPAIVLPGLSRDEAIAFAQLARSGSKQST